MISLRNIAWQAAILGRWTARILGTFAVLFFLAFVFGEGPPNPFALALRENLSFICMTALFLGLALAWYREGWGGAITVAAFAGLAVIGGGHLRMPALQIPTAIGSLHVLCWLILRTPPPAHAARLSIPRRLLMAGAAAMGLFLLLCANEIFANPPLMTPSLRPGPNLVGTWSADPGDTILIQSDGSVTGAVAGVIGYNRSWFGKLMGWRTDYIIQGRGFMLPITLRGSEMTIGKVKTLRKIS